MVVHCVEYYCDKCGDSVGWADAESPDLVLYCNNCVELTEVEE